MLVRVSSTGYLVIPRAIREALGLQPGIQLNLRVVGRQIILEPVESASPADRLYGRFAGVDFLSDMEAEHRREVGDR